METVRSLIDTWADDDPSATFLVAPEFEKILSAAALRAAAVTVADRLAELGLGKGDKAAFLLDNGLWTTALFLGTLYAGRAIVPLNAVAGEQQLRYVLEHSDSRVLFVSARHRERFPALIEAAADKLHVIPTDEDTGPAWPAGISATAGAELPTVSPKDDALLIYTSGTTGHPKGVVLTHANVIAGGRNTAGAHGLTPGDRALCVLPLYHINGEMVTVMAPLVSRGSVVMPHRYSSSKFWGLIERWHCTWFSVVPTIIAYLLEHHEREGRGDREGERQPQLRFGRSASAPLSPSMHQLFEERFGVPMVETMGLTETAAQILANPMPPVPPRYGSPGVPYGNEAKIIDENGREAPSGEVGELLIRGANVMKGYYKNAEATRVTLGPDGWFHTGDLAYRDEDGYYFITGRLKELIIKGGENIAPREIDEALYQHPAVLEAAAFGVPDKHYGQEVMACVVLKPDAECPMNQLQAFCVEQLGDYRSPRTVISMEALPKGPSGKIQRLKLAELVAANPDSKSSKSTN